MQSTARPTLGLLALSATLALSAAVVSAPRPALAQSAQAKAAYDEGIRFKQAKDHKAAAGAFERALQLDGRYAAAWTELGNSRLALGQTDSAIEAFQSALAIDPNDQTARYNAAYALRQQRRYEEAAEAYQQYLQRSPDDPDAHYGLAE
ncbi:MAG: tetratricopeptide repeat protein, partial [Myxococcales bacterium]|nr:tetratricopeptide repeat protein [Myxococcales bacterium]